MTSSLTEHLKEALAALKQEGLFKAERVIQSAQQAQIETADGRTVINFCANNYLGLANHPQVVEAARAA